jgi:hypothetical protein
MRLIIVAAVLLFVFLPLSAKAQRDYFTPEEIELIRDAQEIDRRIDVLVRAIDRRFEVLKAIVGAPVVPKDDKSKWGQLPEGTRAEMLVDIKRILRKAIDDIDTLAERPESAVISATKDPKKAKKIEDIFPKAVKNLAKAAERYQPVLKAELDKTTDMAEKGSILETIEMCDEIIAAVPKLPTALPKKKDT